MKNKINTKKIGLFIEVDKKVRQVLIQKKHIPMILAFLTTFGTIMILPKEFPEITLPK